MLRRLRAQRNQTLQAIADAGLAQVEARGRSPARCRSRHGGAGARSTSATSASSSARPSGSPVADQALLDRGRKEADDGRRVLAFGRVGARSRPTSASRPSRPACGRSGSSSSPSGCGRTRRDCRLLREQNVELKMLSGDAPATVGGDRPRRRRPGDGRALNGEALPTDAAALRDAVLAAPAVGRISPGGQARRRRGAARTPAATSRCSATASTTCPALKAARLAIAQGSGVQMARSVADLVLVHGDFAVVPGMVAEGRQILRNIQRVAQLFVTKSVFAAFIGLAVAIPTATYPLLPRQFTLASTVTIGIPAFVLALAPSAGPWRPEGFLRRSPLRDSRRVLRSGSASPRAICSRATASTSASSSRERWRPPRSVFCGLAVVMRLEGRSDRRRVAVGALCALMGLLFLLALVVPFLRDFYELAKPSGDIAMAWAIAVALGVGGMLGALRLTGQGWKEAGQPATGEA